MANRIAASKGNPYPLGATVLDNHTINFAVVLSPAQACGVLFYHKKTKKEEKILFSRENTVGNIYCIKVSGISASEYEYNFFRDETIVTDPYAKVIVGNEKWGELPIQLKGGFLEESFDWKEDSQLMHEYADSLIYLLHVRGFSKHTSSGVKNKGCFGGITEKIPYFKELGITAVELMPCYEFLELEENTSGTMPGMKEFLPRTSKLNYWGYKEAFYFAPKQSYSSRNGSGFYYNDINIFIPQRIFK